MRSLESREGYRWAHQTAQQVIGLTTTIKGFDEVLNILNRGLLGDKPEGYKEGVRQFVDELEIAAGKGGIRRRVGHE